MVTSKMAAQSQRQYDKVGRSIVASAVGLKKSQDFVTSWLSSWIFVHPEYNFNDLFELNIDLVSDWPPDRLF